jgi:antirestriction protein ArdC
VPFLCRVAAGLVKIGSPFLYGALDTSAEPRTDYAAYIDSWLRILKGDRKAIFTAASAANRAAEYLCYFENAMLQHAA